MNWENRAKRLIKSELAKRDFDYVKLAKLMNDIGSDEKQANIANKINHGKFDFSFALQIFAAIGVTKLDLRDVVHIR